MVYEPKPNAVGFLSNALLVLYLRPLSKLTTSLPRTQEFTVTGGRSKYDCVQSRFVTSPGDVFSFAPYGSVVSKCYLFLLVMFRIRIIDAAQQTTEWAAVTLAGQGSECSFRQERGQWVGERVQSLLLN